jgi:hypothetical protein
MEVWKIFFGLTVEYRMFFLNAYYVLSWYTLTKKTYPLIFYLLLFMIPKHYRVIFLANLLNAWCETNRIREGE